LSQLWAGAASSPEFPFELVSPGSQQDGWADLFVTNVDREMHSLYHNNQDETFDDMSIPNGIGRVTPLLSGWGVKYFDFDNDGKYWPSTRFVYATR
jgi:enediyne biosynthesis protein E4